MATRYEVSISIVVTEKDRFGKTVRSPVITWESETKATTLSELGNLLERIENTVKE